jgi:hypothetical protein
MGYEIRAASCDAIVMSRILQLGPVSSPRARRAVVSIGLAFAAALSVLGTSDVAQAQSCDSGEEPCASGCMPIGYVCCGSDGSTTYSCDPSFPYCCPGNEVCSTTYEGCSGGSSGSGSSGSGSSGSGSSGSGYGGDVSCATASGVSSECPTVDACCDSNLNCWYEADGQRFDCYGGDCYSAAEDLVAYCEDAYGGCSTASSDVSSGSAAFGLVGLLGLAASVRIARWRRANKRRSA